MKTISVVVGMNVLEHMVRQVNITFKPMSYVNGVNGDELTVTPDMPSIGFATVEVISQEDDIWGN